MVYPVHSHVEGFFVVQTVPANRSDLTVGTNEILDPPHVFSEAHILKSEHVIHEPVGSDGVPVHRGFCGAEVALISHGWQEQLVGDDTPSLYDGRKING